MIVTFALQEDTGEPLASLRAPYMVRSIRRFMPEARIVQLSNMSYPQVEGIDEVLRHPFMEDFIVWAFGALIRLLDRNEPVLQIATDVLIQRNLDYVFDGDFDVAACRYPTRDRTDGAYCGDVNFIKSSGLRFFEHVLDIYQETPHIQNGWDGGQKAFLTASQRDRFRIKALDFDIFCKTPESPGEDLSQAALIHFRGQRKAWMIPTAKALGL